MCDDQKPKRSDKNSLSDGDIETTRGLNRRRLLRGMGLGTIGLGLSGCVVPATTGTGMTDSDNGPITDAGGNGRGGRRSVRTGLTDADNGPITDAGGYGRGGGGGFTPVSSGITDSDNGPITDPAGNGRGGRRGYYTGITDSDNGPITDPSGQGRGR
ncbi:hypothetical protein E2K80_02545 [Rhodophyticola sp. CCM32]|uniref:hypothetical protein n=1 Tax=Rhodophyticola sp. CCM32 TaxID=2916397 RepID=UPI00107F185A|nr:hypothetical protein [Rhodophyticola sp. CCM32]QBX99739.1 hypothetical protein E2K80_02545 [Rhodophyticola sp. CCM32]